MPLDMSTAAQRRQIIEEIKSEENISRKRNAQRKFDVYRNRQDRYILEKLRDEFSEETVQEMRKILSINIAKPMVDKMSSLYTREPKRSFENVPNDRQQEQLTNLYDIGKVDVQMRLANKYFKLGDQCALWTFPKNGMINTRVLFPHMYDVIPDPNDPERAAAYILNVWDLDFRKSTEGVDSLRDESQNAYTFENSANEKIADDNDRRALLDRYVVWTDDLHFTMDGTGEVVSEVIENPIGRLPFVDISFEKDFQFFVKNGNNLVDFTIDFGAQLSDLANIMRMQNYSQAVISATKKPVHMKVGPDTVLFLQIDPENPDIKPQFEFVTPSPDLSGSLEILESQMKLFLSSLNIDTTSLVVRGGDVKQFTSGIDRFLAMVKEFEASKEDIGVFEDVEQSLFKIMRDWSNVLQSSTDDFGNPVLKDELRVSQISDDIGLNIQYSEPESAVTEKDKLDVIERKVEMGLMSRVEALMELRDVSKEKAEELVREFDGGMINGESETNGE